MTCQLQRVLPSGQHISLAHPMVSPCPGLRGRERNVSTLLPSFQCSQ